MTNKSMCKASCIPAEACCLQCRSLFEPSTSKQCLIFISRDIQVLCFNCFTFPVLNDVRPTIFLSIAIFVVLAIVFQRQNIAFHCRLNLKLASLKASCRHLNFNGPRAFFGTWQVGMGLSFECTELFELLEGPNNSYIDWASPSFENNFRARVKFMPC